MGLPPARLRPTGVTTFIRSQVPLPHNTFRLIAHGTPLGGPFMEENLKVNKAAESRQARPYPTYSSGTERVGIQHDAHTMVLKRLWSRCGYGDFLKMPGRRSVNDATRNVRKKNVALQGVYVC